MYTHGPGSNIAPRSASAITVSALGIPERRQPRALERVHGDVHQRRGAVADVLAVVEHRRLVLLALADHDDAVHRHACRARAASHPRRPGRPPPCPRARSGGPRRAPRPRSRAPTRAPGCDPVSSTRLGSMPRRLPFATRGSRCCTASCCPPAAPDDRRSGLRRVARAAAPTRRAARTWSPTSSRASTVTRPSTSSSRKLSDPADRELFYALRERVDAVLVGTRTLAAEHYKRMLPQAERRERRTRSRPTGRAAGRHRQPQRSRAARDPAVRRRTRRVLRVRRGRRPAGRRPAHAPRVMHGVETLLCEGGPTLFGALLREGPGRRAVPDARAKPCRGSVRTGGGQRTTAGGTRAVELAERARARRHALPALQLV